MKRYKLNLGQKVNTRTSKSGIRWEYCGRFETIDQALRRYTLNKNCLAGVRITDIESGEIVFEEEC